MNPTTTNLAWQSPPSRTDAPVTLSDQEKRFALRLGRCIAGRLDANRPWTAPVSPEHSQHEHSRHGTGKVIDLNWG